MINQQMLDYIKQQMNAGVSQDQIKNALLNNRWPIQDIEEGFNSINVVLALDVVPQTPNVFTETAATASISTWQIITSIVISIAILVSGIFLASQTIFKSKKASNTANQTLNQPSAKNTTKETTTTQSQNPELVFADKLSSCTRYKITFKHPLTGDMLDKEILGTVGGKCDYVEQMPNNGKMECKYPKTDLAVVAKYYKDVANSTSVSTSVNTNSSSGQQTTVYKINGKEVDNPIQEAMNSGVCVVSGY